MYNISMSDSDFDVNYYLDHIYDEIDPNIKLDEQQKAAVVGDEACALVVAGAGTGKTTTIAAKVKYLVDIKKVAPEKILVMSYTSKSVEELRRRINTDLGIPAYVTTFHSLGLNYLRSLYEGKKIIPIDVNERERYFVDYLSGKIFPNPVELERMVSLFNDDTISHLSPKMHTYGKYFLENYPQFSNFDEYFEAYIDHKKKETQDIVERVNDIADSKVNGERPVTIKGEFVKSKGEAIIANFLLCNGVDYSYERVYSELVGDNRIYRPDFTVDIGGEKIYIEYFGLSGSSLDNRSYQSERKEKEEYHRLKGNKFISLDYLPNRGYLRVLADELRRYGAVLKPKPIEEIYEIILRQNPLAEFFGLKDFIYKMIDAIKTSDKIHSFEEFKSLCERCVSGENSETQETMRQQLDWITDYWNYYCERNTQDSDRLRVDFSDMIMLPLGHIGEVVPEKYDFDYVIVDEYQDISSIRFELLRETIKSCGAKFFAIGDDWQSIYSFQGAKVGYIIDFEKYFPGAKRYVIEKTYRNAQQLIDSAGAFVMRNGRQIKKDLRSNKDLYRPICFVGYKAAKKEKNGIPSESRNDMVEKIVRTIHKKYPNDSIGVLGRTNSSIKALFDTSNFVNSAENKVKIKGIKDFYFDALTIHSSKGLTYDWVIILPLTSSFPSDPKSYFWMYDLIRNNPEEEDVSYAEQRRLFYVALTRTKNRVYLLFQRNGKHSRYKDELARIIADLDERRERFDG